MGITYVRVRHDTPVHIVRDDARISPGNPLHGKPCPVCDAPLREDQTLALVYVGVEPVMRKTAGYMTGSAVVTHSACTGPAQPARKDAPTEVWRPGRKVGRALYLHQDGAETGKLIGVVDTPELAAAICDAMNAVPDGPKPCSKPAEAYDFDSDPVPPIEVIRVNDAAGSHVQPPFRDHWDEPTKLAWQASVVAHDTGLDITVRASNTSRRPPRRWWRPRPQWRQVHGMYTLQVGTSVITPLTFAAAWDLLTGISVGATRTRARS